MRICRYQLAGEAEVRVGIVRGNLIHDVTPVTRRLPALHWPFPPGDQLIAHLPELRGEMETLADAVPGVPVGEVALKNPVANPGKFLCGAGNYEDVLAMGGHPRRLGLLFKMTSAAAGASDGVTLRWPERVTFHEMEIAIVIGRIGTEIAAKDAYDYIAGYCIGLDMTMQGKEFPSFGKSFDSYGVMGPWLVTADEIPDPTQLEFDLKINGVSKQRDSLRRLVLNVPDLVEHVSSIMTIHPGDVIFSGTPPRSVGPVVPGDVMHAWMEGIGEMTVAVRGGPGRKTPMDGMEA